MDDDDRYVLSTGAAAQILGVHRDTVRKWADNGTIPFWRTPPSKNGQSERRFRRSDLEALRAEWDRQPGPPVKRVTP